MANVKWQGKSSAVAQQQSFAFGGTWEANDVIRASIGSATYDFTAGSTVTATVVSALVTAWNNLSASSYPEFAEMTASAPSSTTFLLTADTAGVPFVVTLTPLEANLGAADAQTIEGAGTATTGTAAVANVGPSSWSTAANWSGGSVPTTGDNVYIEDSEDDIKYELDQSGVTLASLNIAASFTGTIGLPILNTDGTTYYEYRPTSLAIGATTLDVGKGSGSGSGRLKIDNGSVQTAATVRVTGSPLDDEKAAVQWKGTHASNTLSVYGGTADVAMGAAETAAVATLRVGTDVSGDATVRCGSGTTLTTITQLSGSLTIGSAATTITKSGGSLRVLGTGAITTLTNSDGLFEWLSSGTITTYNGGPSSTLDASQDLRARTITTTTLTPGAAVSDPGGVVVFTNGIVLSRGKLANYGLDVGYNRTISVA